MTCYQESIIIYSKTFECKTFTDFTLQLITDIQCAVTAKIFPVNAQFPLLYLLSFHNGKFCCIRYTALNPCESFEVAI